MEDEDGMVNNAGSTDGTIQRADDSLGQNGGGASRKHEMEHGVAYVTKAKAGLRNPGRRLQGSIKTNKGNSGRRQEMDADDQTTMDELFGARDAREQRTDDEGGHLVV